MTYLFKLLAIPVVVGYMVKFLMLSMVMAELEAADRFTMAVLCLIAWVIVCIAGVVGLCNQPPEKIIVEVDDYGRVR